MYLGVDPECDWRCRRRRPRMLGLPPGADNVHLALYSRCRHRAGGKGGGRLKRTLSVCGGRTAASVACQLQQLQRIGRQTKAKMTTAPGCLCHLWSTSRCPIDLLKLLWLLLLIILDFA